MHPEAPRTPEVAGPRVVPRSFPRPAAGGDLPALETLSPYRRLHRSTLSSEPGSMRPPTTLLVSPPPPSTHPVTAAVATTSTAAAAVAAGSLRQPPSPRFQVAGPAPWAEKAERIRAGRAVLPPLHTEVEPEDRGTRLCFRKQPNVLPRE